MSDHRCGFCRQSMATVEPESRFIFVADKYEFKVIPFPKVAIPADIGPGPAGSTWLCSKADCLLSAFTQWRHKIREGHN